MTHITTKLPEKLLKHQAIPYINMYALYIKNYNRYVSKSDDSVELYDAMLFTSPEAANRFLLSTNRNPSQTIIVCLTIIQTEVHENYFIKSKILDLENEIIELKTQLK